MNIIPDPAIKSKYNIDYDLLLRIKRINKQIPKFLEISSYLPPEIILIKQI